MATHSLRDRQRSDRADGRDLVPARLGLHRIHTRHRAAAGQLHERVAAAASFSSLFWLGVAVSFGSYYWSDKIALATAGAQLVTPQQAPELHGVIDRLCALADMPKPRVAIAPADMPNAFATGRSSKVAVVCVTQGLLARLDRNELEGVLAHEMSHVAHKDVAVMTIASFLGIVAGLLVRFAFYSELFGGGGRDRGRGGGNDQNTIPVIFLVMAVGIVVYAISFLLIRLLSRYRELSADRSGALLTGQPSALASALVKVSGEIARIPTRDLRAAEPLNAFYFAPALVRSPWRDEPVHAVLHAPAARKAAQGARRDLQAAQQQVRGRAGGVPRLAARPHEAGAAESGRVVRAAVRGDHAAGGDGLHADRYRIGLLPRGRGQGVRRYREGRHRPAQHGREQGPDQAQRRLLRLSPGWCARTRPTTSKGSSPTCTR